MAGTESFHSHASEVMRSMDFILFIRIGLRTDDGKSIVANLKVSLCMMLVGQVILTILNNGLTLNVSVTRW